MKRVLYQIAANATFFGHSIIVLILLLGWLNPFPPTVYVIVLVATLGAELSFGYCPLTRLEFTLRRHYQPTVKFGASFVSYYTAKLLYRLWRIRIPEDRVRKAAVLFLATSLGVMIIRLIL